MAKLRASKYFPVVMTLMLVLGLCTAAVPLGCGNNDPVVTIPDAGLEAVIREALNTTEGDIYASESSRTRPYAK